LVEEILLLSYQSCHGLIPHAKPIELHFLNHIPGLQSENFYAMGSEEPSNIYRIERQTKKAGPIKLALFFSEPSEEDLFTRRKRAVDAAMELARGRAKRAPAIDCVVVVIVDGPRDGDRTNRRFDSITVIGNPDCELYPQIQKLFSQCHSVEVRPQPTAQPATDNVSCRSAIGAESEALLKEISSSSAFQRLLSESAANRLIVAERITSYLAQPSITSVESSQASQDGSLKQGRDLVPPSVPSNEVILDKGTESDSPTMTTNPHVATLNEYQPFGAGFKQIYFESSNLDLLINTKAFCSLKDVIEKGETRVVILTGDAGHGKTHLCGQVLSDVLGVTIARASELLRASDPDQDVAYLPDERGLRIIKDLSEFDPERGKQLLQEASLARSRVTIICANEGRLRNCANLVIAELLDENLTTGRSRSQDGALVMINLNFQSVASRGEEPNIFRQVVQQWVKDDAKWESCQSCEVRKKCPIYFNRLCLSDESAASAPLNGIETLLRISEQTGHIVTIRTLLMFVAHLLTGRLSCEEVHGRSRLPADWQGRYLYHQLAFGDQVPSDMQERIQVFSSIRRLDPGLQAIRQVDDLLDLQSDSIDFPLDFDDPSMADGNSGTRQNAKVVAQANAAKWRMMRRRSFFETDYSAKGAVQRSVRLGLSHLDDFEKVLENDTEVPEVRDRIMRGLEAVQGVYRDGTKPLLLVHGAFSSQSAQTCIVDTLLKVTKVRHMSLFRAWDRRSEGTADVKNRVDWLDRAMIVSLNGPHAPPEASLQLYLHEFEFLMRSSQGLRSREFFAAEIRRLSAQLARISRPGGDTFEVTVYDGVAVQTLLIEDGRIRRVST
jgi:dephospho-CoA kinase